MVYRIYVEKKPGFDVEAEGLKNELVSLLGVSGLTGLRLLNRRGCFPKFDLFIEQTKDVWKDMLDIRKRFEPRAEELARKYALADYTMFIGSGALWGETILYSMCLLEEMQWKRIRHITSHDFFHGTLELLEPGVPVFLFMGEDECRALGGCFLDYLSGQYRINLLEPRCWDDGSGPEDPDAPDAFRGTLLSQHISFLRDVFRVYKGFDTPHIDTLELMVEQLYQKWNITDRTDFAAMRPADYPILSDLYDTIQEAYDNYDAAGLYPREMLRDLLLGLHSMCRGADARFFNGHTNITNSKFLVFCVKGLDNRSEEHTLNSSHLKLSRMPSSA